MGAIDADNAKVKEFFDEKYLSSLPRRERETIKMRYKEGYTPEEIAWYFDISSSRIGEILGRHEKELAAFIKRGGGGA
jgi:DNA-directed RNA polymerase specialized sigma24 family protein